MNSPSNILNFYSQTNSEYLHSKGRFATEILLQRIECNEKENILEIGFGTGATLVYLSSIYKNTHFFGIEFSKLMFEKATSRISFCLVKNVKLVLNSNSLILPYNDNFFDKIYLESVLAIQEGDDLIFILKEIFRTLKPGGKLIFNEGIWLDSVSKKKIREINEFCKSKFGIIQCNEKYSCLSDWEAALQKTGFVIESIENLDEIKNFQKTGQPFLSKTLSNLFTSFGKLRSKINPKFRKQFSEFQKEMLVLSGEERYLQGIIIKSKAVK